MTTPNIVNPKYLADTSAFRNAKVDRSGSVRGEAFSVSVPSGTTVAAGLIGLVPFQSGAKFNYDSSIFADALGTSVTVSLGYVYDTPDANLVDNNAAFLALTAANTAGTKLVPNVAAGNAWKAIDSTLGVGALANGWIVAKIGGATTGTTASIYGQINMMYDQP